jgi:prepilin-type processing-associated H-X9-DG protein
MDCHWVMKVKQSQIKIPVASDNSHRAFTLLELTVMLMIIALGLLMLVPALAESRIDGQALSCRNNHRQLLRAWQMYAADFNDLLPAADQATATASGRPNWMTGNMTLPAGNSSLLNTNTDIVRGPLWPYSARKADIYRCPADPRYVTLAGKKYHPVRTVAMSCAFGNGAWLNGVAGDAGPYRLYSKLSDVRVPPHTFVFIDEHPNSIDDGEMTVSCAGAQPGDAPTLARIIEYPAPFHNGGATLSFADGHVEIHNWIGSLLRTPIVYDQSGLLPLPVNVSAGDSAVDIAWLAANTTVKK